MRPQSIVNFERCYLGAIALGLISSYLNRDLLLARVYATSGNPGAVSTGVGIGLIIGLGVVALFWYFIAKRGSVVAKWILTVLVVIRTLLTLLGLASGAAPRGLATVLEITGLVLLLVATWLMFRPDTKRWFGGRDNDLGSTFS